MHEKSSAADHIPHLRLDVRLFRRSIAVFMLAYYVYIFRHNIVTSPRAGGAQARPHQTPEL